MERDLVSETLFYLQYQIMDKEVRKPSDTKIKINYKKSPKNLQNAKNGCVHDNSTFNSVLATKDNAHQI
jgi:hypothetical protein